ncbi:MAG: hypothetical protein ABIP51_15035 [Bacteroidia bacterium]
MQNISKLNEILKRWFTGTGKPNSIDGNWNIHQVINFRSVMGFSHNLQVYSATKNYDKLDRLFSNRSKNEIGRLKQLSRSLKNKI